MSLKSFRMIGVFSLALLGTCLATKPAAAQEQGWPFNPQNRWWERSSSRVYRSYRPSAIQTAPAVITSNAVNTQIQIGGSVTGSTGSNRQFYPAETLSDSKAAGFVVRLPIANADVWFEDQKTQQLGTVREYVSGNLDPNFTYTFHIRARWTDNGRAVEQTRNLDARAGQQLVVDFTGSPK